MSELFTNKQEHVAMHAYILCKAIKFMVRKISFIYCGFAEINVIDFARIHEFATIIRKLFDYS